MKNISLLLVFLLLLQSCSVYNKPASVEEALAADKKAKVITTDNQKYKFTRLEKRNDRLFGTTKLGSATATKLAGMPAMIDGKYLEVDISSVDIEQVRLRNTSASTIATVGAIAGTLLVTLYTAFLISFANSEWTFGTGSE